LKGPLVLFFLALFITQLFWLWLLFEGRGNMDILHTGIYATDGVKFGVVE
jgi:hypothetical protein